MGGTGRHAQRPPSQIPEDRRANGGKNDRHGYVPWVYDPFSQSLGHGRSQKPGAGEFEDGDQENDPAGFHGPGDDRSGDQVRAVIEPIAEFKKEDEGDQQDRRGQDVEFQWITLRKPGPGLEPYEGF